MGTRYVRMSCVRRLVPCHHLTTDNKQPQIAHCQAISLALRIGAGAASLATSNRVAAFLKEKGLAQKKKAS